MRSPRHRANILDPEYNAIGIGVVLTAREVFVTQDFARGLPETSVDRAEEQVARNLAPAADASPHPSCANGPARWQPATGWIRRPESRRCKPSVTFTAIDTAGEIPETLDD